MGRFLGQNGPTATITYIPSSKLVQWSTSGAGDAEIYVNGTLFARAPSGQQAAPWVMLGDTYLFELKDSTGAVLATVYIDAAGTVTGQTIYGGEIPPPPGGGGVPAAGGGAPPPNGGAPPGSWFEQSTNIFGADVPNLALIAGGGLLLLAVVARKR